MSMKERVVIITGAAGGLGSLAAQRFVRLGARLVLVGNQAAKLGELVAELKLPDEKVLTVAGNLSEAETSRQLAAAVLAKFGRADAVLHLVGGWAGGKPVTQVSADEVTSMLDQHLWTTFHLLQAITPLLVRNGWGRVVVVSSAVVGETPPNRAPYTIGKSAQEALVVSLAEELKGSGVSANVLRVRTIDAKHERESAPSEKNAGWTTQEELVGAMEYLCSEEGGAVNGAKIPLYGGG